MSNAKGCARLLDAWDPPDDAGKAVGCLATTFTFDAAFFEEECLGRFVGMQTDPDEDGAAYLLEREEKLAELSYAGCIVDGHNCRGARSLRWDLLGAYVPFGGIMHAKIAVLQWARHVRIIVASANLTPSGYRKNLEVFGVLDFAPEALAPRSVFDGLVSALQETLVPLVRADEQAQLRLTGFLQSVQAQVASWTLKEDDSLRVWPIVVAPGRPHLIAQLAKLPPASQRFYHAEVVSPFFDRDGGTPYRPADRLWTDLLRLRGDATLHYHIPATPSPDGKAVFLHAPATLLDTRPRQRSGCETRALALYRDDEESVRDLHAKLVWLESDNWIVYLLGSSNFTSAGYGVGESTVNIEANLAYGVPRQRNPAAEKALIDAFPEGKELPTDRAIFWQPEDPAGQDEPGAGAVLLPAAFVAAVFDRDESGGIVRFTFDSPPPGWQVIDEVSNEVIVDVERVDMDSLGNVATIRWLPARPPTGFLVRWSNSAGDAWWPVTVAAGAALPPPEELRNLPLDVLLDMLTSARPLYRNEALRRYLRRKDNETVGTIAMADDLDPHRRVDTSTFLLQRTRRVSWALGRLRERLQQPFASAHSLDWRLRGPIGVLYLATALDREAHSAEERAFLLAELILELRRVVPEDQSGCVPAAEVRRAIDGVIFEIARQIPEQFVTNNRVDAFGRYLRKVITTAGATL